MEFVPVKIQVYEKVLYRGLAKYLWFPVPGNGYYVTCIGKLDPQTRNLMLEIRHISQLVEDLNTRMYFIKPSGSLPFKEEKLNQNLYKVLLESITKKPVS